MKIVITTENFLPSVGGVEYHTELLAMELNKKQYEVIVFCFKKYDSHHYVEGVKVLYGFSLKNIWEAFYGADLVISNGELSIKSVLLSVLLFKKNICLYHMALPYLNVKKGILAFIKRSFQRLLVYYPEKHIAVSESVLKALSLPVSNVGVLYNTVSYKIQSLIEDERRKNHTVAYDLLFCGRIIKGKGVLILADALKIISSRERCLNVLIIGDGTDKSEFQKRTSDLNGVNITYKPFLRSEELIPYYYQSKVMVLPSTTHKEGSPLTLIEMLLVGKPVIVSNQEAMIETVGSAGYVVLMSNPISLADAIQSVLFDEGKYQQLVTNCLVENKKYELSNFSSSINFYFS